MAQVERNHHHHQHALGLRGLNRRQGFAQGRRVSREVTCTCAHCVRSNSGSQLFDPFSAHEPLGFAGDRRCYSEAPAGISVSHAEISHLQQQQQQQHHHLRGCEARCCGGGGGGGDGGSSALMNHRGSISEADSVIDRMRASLKCSHYSFSGDVQRCASACGCLSHQQPSVSMNGDMRSCSLDTSAKANLPTSGQAVTGCTEQIVLHDWYLMKPKSGDNARECSSMPRVSIGGYRTPELLAADFVQTAQIEHRLKRWKLRTVDGVEVILMGMANLSKAVACGFSPVLAQYFLIGFPVTWVYMLLNLSSGPLKASRTDSHSSPALRNLPSEVQSQDKNDSCRENHNVGEENVFSAAVDQETWRTQLLRSSVTGSAMPERSADVHGRVQYGLGKEPSDGLESLNQASMLEPQLSSEERDGPCFDPEEAGLSADTGMRPADGDQRKHLDGFWDCLVPPSEGDVVGVGLEAHEGNEHARNSTLVTDTAGPAVDGFANASAAGSPESGTQLQKQQADTGSPHFTVNTIGAGEAPSSACVSEEQACVDPALSSGKRADFIQSQEVASERANSLGPCTPVQKPREPTQVDAASVLDVDNTIAEAGTDPVATPQNMVSGRILRSGRCLPLSDTLLERTSVRPESPPLNTKIRKRPRTPTADTAEDGAGFGSSGPDETLREQHELLSGQEQAPPTLVEATELGRHDESVYDDATFEIDPSSAVQDLKLKKGGTRANGRHPKTDKTKQKPVVDPLNTLQTMQFKKRLRSHAVQESLVSNPTRQAVAEGFSSQSGDRDVPSCNVAVDDYINIQNGSAEKRTSSEAGFLSKDTDSQPSVACKGSSPDPEILIKDEEQVRMKSRGPTKKRHRGPNVYRSRRRKLESRNSQSCRQKQESKQLHVSGDLPEVDKVESLKPHDEVTALRRDGNASQISRATRSQKARGAVRSNANQVADHDQRVKREGRSRNSQILPPPLPPPLVPNKSKVTEAFGLKRSRYGRILVPTLANWCNQVVKYDMDGSIIAISDGHLTELHSDTGCYKFPADKGSRSMQKKCQRAADTAWTRQ